MLNTGDLGNSLEDVFVTQGDHLAGLVQDATARAGAMNLQFEDAARDSDTEAVAVLRDSLVRITTGFGLRLYTPESHIDLRRRG